MYQNLSDFFDCNHIYPRMDNRLYLLWGPKKFHIKSAYISPRSQQISIVRSSAPRKKLSTNWLPGRPGAGLIPRLYLLPKLYLSDDPQLSVTKKGRFAVSLRRRRFKRSLSRFTFWSEPRHLFLSPESKFEYSPPVTRPFLIQQMFDIIQQVLHFSSYHDNGF